MSHSFISIRTSTMLANVALEFDVYLQISGKFLCYVKRKDNFDPVRLEKLNSKNVRELFIDENDMLAYQNFLNVCAKQALSDPSMPISRRADVIVGQSKAAVEDIFSNPSSEAYYTQTKNAAKNHVQMLLDTPEAFEHMIKNTSFDKSTFQHSVNVATLAILLAHEAEASDSVCNVIGLGALLHDIGRPNEDRIEKMDAEGKKKFLASDKYRQHSRHGAQILVDKKYVARDVLDVIVMHEERLDGRGFPSGTKKIDPIFQVVGLSNLYDQLVTFDGLTPADAFVSIRKEKPYPYDEDLIDMLEKILKTNKIYG